MESLINKSIEVSQGYLKAGGKITSIIRPDIISNDAITTPMVIAACKWLKDNGGKVVLFNHTSNTYQEDIFCKSIANLWASQGIVYSEYATHNALRTPSIAKLAQDIYGAAAQHNIYPVIFNQKIEKPPHDKFIIIFAGNYMTIKDQVPYLAETPYEFTESILKLAEAVSKIPEAELIIKLKARKKECDQETIEKLMPKYENVFIKSSGSLKEELQNCDLLVANLSGTIDEALESHTPVMLYSSTYRYKHLQGMSNIPTSNSRCAVYNPSRDIDLYQFILGIISAHKNKPLQPDELKDYIWQNGYDMAAFAKLLLTK
jgi:hypothetical protein